ncbi:MAG: DUF222 domain-containing protein [Actinomycetota bacterium]
MSELRSAVESLRGETLAELPDARIEEDFAEICRIADQLELEALRRLGEIERRRLFERDGHLSAAAWLAAAFKMSWGVARDQVRTARTLEQMPATRAAIEAGDVSMCAARSLVAARDTDPTAFATAELQLVEAARIHSIGDLGRVVAYWRQAVERERGIDGEEALRARRRLHASVTMHGMVRVDGTLDPETGETVLTALRAVVDAETRGRSKGEVDARSPAQRRADALGEVCRQWLDRPDRPTVGGELPHLTVTVSAETLAGGAGVCEMDHVGPIPIGTARHLACDASVMRVVLSERSEPLDVGRRSKVVPPPMRRAVIVRDRRCRFPGCDRPHTWCDAHHVVHWADGGPTALSNLILFCRQHHRAIHAGRARLHMEDGLPVFRRPDGSRLEHGSRVPVDVPSSPSRQNPSAARTRCTCTTRRSGHARTCRCPSTSAAT